MDINVTTPALLFPAISLLLLAYTNRFLALASLIRNLHDRYQAKPDEGIIAQIDNLRYRVILIRNMQAFGVMSLLLCVICMFILFAGQMTLGKITFGISLVLMMISLGLSIREIQVSVNALNVQLKDLEVKDALPSHEEEQEAWERN
jgi:hypothetical protein